MTFNDIAAFVSNVGMPTLVALWGLWVTTKLLTHKIEKMEKEDIDDGKKDA